MKKRTLVAAILMGAGWLVGCDNKDAVVSLTTMNPVADSLPRPRHWIEIPALPIIQQGVSELAPRFSDQSHIYLMEKICGLARGELEHDQVMKDLDRSQSVEGSIPKQFSRLANGEKSIQQTACAAYLASSAPQILNSSELPQPVTFAVSGLNAADSSRFVRKEAQTGSKSNAELEPSSTSARPVEQPLLRGESTASVQQPLSTTLAIARANADVFAFIAIQLQRRPGLSLAEYKMAAGQLFAQLAPTYLERLQALTRSPGLEYHLLSTGPGRLTFSSSDGGYFESSAQSLSLLQNGVPWYGQGKLLGHDYPLLVAYFDPSISQFLTPSVQ